MPAEEPPWLEAVVKYSLAAFLVVAALLVLLLVLGAV